MEYEKYVSKFGDPLENGKGDTVQEEYGKKMVRTRSIHVLWPKELIRARSPNDTPKAPRHF